MLGNTKFHIHRLQVHSFRSFLLSLGILSQSWPRRDRLVASQSSSFECLLLEEQMQGRRLFCKGYAIPQRAQKFIELKEIMTGVMILARKCVVINRSPFLSHDCARSNSFPLNRFVWVFLPPDHDTILIQCGQHDINDELVFENNEGYIFHDSLGFESGNEDELKVVQDFVRKKAGERRLQDRLHVIWFVLFVIGMTMSDTYHVGAGIVFRQIINVHPWTQNISMTSVQIKMVCVPVVCPSLSYAIICANRQCQSLQSSRNMTSSQIKLR